MTRRRLNSIVYAALCGLFALCGSALLTMLELRGWAFPAPPAVAGPYTGPLRLEAPAAADAGTPVIIRAVGPATDGAEAVLVAVGSYGPHLYKARFVAGAATFLLPAEDTRRAGVVSLAATAGLARADAAMQIRPGPPAAVGAPLVAPRSVCAGAEEGGLAAVVAADSHGNPPPDGAPVGLVVRAPDGGVRELALRTSGGLAWGEVAGGSAAGRVSLRAAAEAGWGGETPLIVTACEPAPFALTAEPASLPADGRLTLTLRAGPLRDRFGNTFPDGTLVTFLAELPDGPRRIPALLVGGMAEAPLQASSRPGEAVVRAAVQGRTSAAIVITFTRPGDDD
jgi:hypothetical protein